jgi:hypothetical protein
VVSAADPYGLILGFLDLYSFPRLSGPVGVLIDISAFDTSIS